MDVNEQLSEYDEEAPELSFRKPLISELAQALGRQQDVFNHAVVPSTVVYGLSEMTGEELKAVVPVWNRPVRGRQAPRVKRAQ